MLSAMVFAEFSELRDARHGAVVVHDFADHAAVAKASQPRQIDGGFGLPSSHQHAAFARAQREDVTGADQIARVCWRGRWRREWCARDRPPRCRW